MQLQPLSAISPIDGRYHSQLQHLSEYFSELALIKYRVKVEIEYFLFLAEKKFFKLSPLLKKQFLKKYLLYISERVPNEEPEKFITLH